MLDMVRIARPFNFVKREVKIICVMCTCFVKVAFFTLKCVSVVCVAPFLPRGALVMN